MPNVWSQCQWVFDDDRDRVARQLADRVGDLPRLDRRRAGVDDEDVTAAEDHPDLLVEEREAPGEDAIADLQPAMPAMVSTRVGVTRLA